MLLDGSRLHWRKSSYSSQTDKNCVEVAAFAEGRAVRDSTQRDTGPILTFGAPAWRAFVTALPR